MKNAIPRSHVLARKGFARLPAGQDTPDAMSFLSSVSPLIHFDSSDEDELSDVCVAVCTGSVRVHECRNHV